MSLPPARPLPALLRRLRCCFALLAACRGPQPWPSSDLDPSLTAATPAPSSGLLQAKGRASDPSGAGGSVMTPLRKRFPEPRLQVSPRAGAPGWPQTVQIKVQLQPQRRGPNLYRLESRTTPGLGEGRPDGWNGQESGSVKTSVLRQAVPLSCRFSLQIPDAVLTRPALRDVFECVRRATGTGRWWRAECARRSPGPQISASQNPDWSSRLARWRPVSRSVQRRSTRSQTWARAFWSASPTASIRQTGAGVADRRAHPLKPADPGADSAPHPVGRPRQGVFVAATRSDRQLQPGGACRGQEAMARSLRVQRQLETQRERTPPAAASPVSPGAQEPAAAAGEGLTRPHRRPSRWPKGSPAGHGVRSVPAQAPWLTAWPAARSPRAEVGDAAADHLSSRGRPASRSAIVSAHQQPDRLPALAPSVPGPPGHEIGQRLTARRRPA